MDRTAAVTHAAHDELLIARFYGGDVDESERVRVLDRMADCRDCAALFADLAAIAEADEAMPVPPRPRDFTLTEEDAVRLRPKRRALSGIFGPGLHRSLGGSLAALGLVGMVLTGAVSLFGAVSTSPDMLASTQERAAELSTPGNDNPAYGVVGMPTAGPAATAAPALAPGATPALAWGAQASSASMAQQGSLDGGTSAAQPAASEAGPTGQVGTPSQDTGVAFGGNAATGTSEPKFLPAEATTGGGMDGRLVWLVGFGALFAIGLATAILPGRRRGGDRSARG
jgi:hypothetical protein